MRKLLIPCLLALLATACAKQGFPSGGPKDTAPPVPVGCQPANESRNFDGNRFFVEFDEYVVLKDAANNVLVSPPLKQTPEYKTKGRGFVVQMADTLQPNTTYLFQFKEAIADFTEGNVLPSYEYVFSTGDAMDTMMLAGSVLQARNGKPWTETVSVLAYRDSRFTADSTDTIATWGQPDLVTRCDKEGHFAFHYIPTGRYRLVAVADKNRNLRVDPADAVAWDTTFVQAVDSIDSASAPRLFISAPERQQQRLLKAEFTNKHHIEITTAVPMQQPIVAGDSVVQHLGSRGDTLHLWLVHETSDTVHLTLFDASGLADTLHLRYRPTTRKGGRNAATIKAEPKLMSALCSGSNAFYDELWLAFANPIKATAESLEAEVMLMTDSSTTHYSITLDSTGLRARIEASLRSGERYRIRLRDSLFTDLYGTPTDSLVFTLTPKDYGTLKVKLNNMTGKPLVVEVLDNRDTVVAHKQLMGLDGEMAFTHLKAGEYRLRAVVDADSNGRWTPGNYRLGRQPEECIVYDKTLQLREKWEMEEQWTVGAPMKRRILELGSGLKGRLPNRIER